MKEQAKIIGIQKTTFFSGRRKVGLDTNILIKLYDNPFLFSYEESRIFNKKDVIFIHRLCFKELIKYLVKKGINESQAEEQAIDFLESHNIKEICHFIPKEEIIGFEKESNEKLKQIGKEHLICHTPDSIILLAFKKENINKIISTDESFKICASFLGIDGSSLPSIDYALSRELKKIFDYKKKFHKRRR